VICPLHVTLIRQTASRAGTDVRAVCAALAARPCRGIKTCGLVRQPTRPSLDHLTTPTAPTFHSSPHPPTAPTFHSSPTQIQHPAAYLATSLPVCPRRVSSKPVMANQFKAYRPENATHPNGYEKLEPPKSRPDSRTSRQGSTVGSV
jgi:hypothetical protein